MKTLKKILFLLTNKERNQFFILIVMGLVMSIINMIGVASILPFVTILSNPGLVETNLILKKMFEISNKFGFETINQFMFLLGVITFALLIISLSFKALTTYFQTYFISTREYTVGKRLIENYVHQPYAWFLNKHSADLGKNILSQVNLVVMNGLNPMINIINQSFVSTAIVILLIISDPKLALIASITLVLSYVFTYTIIRGKLRKIGEQHIKNNKLRFTAVNEVFEAFKEVKIGLLEQSYINKFKDPARKLAKLDASSKVLGQLPHFALEAIAFGGMILLILYFMSNDRTLISVLPYIALYAYAGYRIIPSIQGIYLAVAQLRFIGPSLDALIDDLKGLKVLKFLEIEDEFRFRKDINLNKISYAYPGAKKLTLKDLSITIPVNSTVGLVGATGSGKTTTVDLILGLLEPDQGKLEVDNKVIDRENCRAWQSILGYVPQQIFLADDTVSANIALGIQKDKVDMNAVESAAKIANLHEFIINELPDKYQTTVGDRGIRLSGGQRQRIGIARALYHKPQVLILDEGTSALDNLTERAVMETLNTLKNKITVILIAHRLNTVKNCDNIFLLQNGELKEHGTFNDLAKKNLIFEKMLKSDRS